MRRLLVCQHVPHELLGNLDPLFRASGFRIRYVNFGRDPRAKPRLDGYDGLVLLGGPMNVGETDRYPHIQTEVDLVRKAIDRDIPVLGICLGAQLIAAALGAKIEAASRKEIGWHDVSPTEVGEQDPLFRHFEPTERIFQWHGDTFAIPTGADHLASAPDCPNQAFRYGKKVYGLQFHLEVDEPMIERWLQIPELREEISSLEGNLSPESILAETKLTIERSQVLAKNLFRTLIELFEPPRRTRILSSR